MEYKYLSHSQKQIELIISTAEKLFVEKGIQDVTISEISNVCGIMKATFYRYFKNKDELLFRIMNIHSHELNMEMKTALVQNKMCCFDMFKLLLDILYRRFTEDTLIFKFIYIYKNQYMSMTNPKAVPFESIPIFGDYKSGGLVELLMSGFNDGSVDQSLNPKETAVSTLYLAIMICASFSEQMNDLNEKYGIDTKTVVRNGLDALLIRLNRNTIYK